MKKTILSLIVLLLVFTSCGKNSLPETKEPEREDSVIYQAAALKKKITLQAAVEMFPYIASVEIISEPERSVNNGYWLTAKVIKNYCGMTEDVILMRVGSTELQKGRQYLLFMEKYESVFYQKTYYAYGEAVYTKENGLFTDSLSDLNVTDMRTVYEKLEETLKKTAYKGSTLVHNEYIHSKDSSIVAQQSAVVVEGNVTDVQQTAEDRLLVTIQINKVLKGTAQTSIRAVVPLHSVKAGGAYLFMLSYADSLYVVSSPDSVFPLSSDKAKAVQELLR